MNLVSKKHYSCLPLLLSALIAWLPLQAIAVSPSAAQIEQFKQLPRAEQERLARQMGVDLSDFTGGSGSAPVPTTQPIQTQPRAVTPSYEPVVAVSSDSEVKPTERTLKMYGYDLFENNAEAFTPNFDVPVPEDYVMGPGDSVVVQLYGKENATHNFTLSRDGTVYFPKIGPLSLAGLTFSQVQQLINQTVSEQMIGVNSAVTMGAIRTIRIFVLGEAVQPGSYVVSSLSTMTNALFSSGGVTKIGSLRDIQLKRKGKLVTRLDLYDLLLKGDTRSDARLMPGDVIFIPAVGRTVGVDGEVRRPAIYELKQEQTAGEVLALAGGALPTAFPPKSKIERINANGDRTIVDLDLTAAAGRNARVTAADKIIVPSVLDSLEKIVLLQGHLKRPGAITWKPGMRVSDAISGLDDLLSDPDLDAALIARETQPTRTTQVLMFNLGEALKSRSPAADLALQPRDKLIIFSRVEDREETIAPLISKLASQADNVNREKTVKISGNVRSPGKYPLTKGMTVDQLVKLAGGFKQNAYGLFAEITRYSLDEHQLQRISHLPVDLKLADKVQLESADNLHIRQLPDWVGEQTVQLNGEVMFPGAYSIQRGETLSQLIERAGGLTQDAYPEAAVFTREELRALEAKRLQDLEDQLRKDIVASNIEVQSEETQVDEADAQALLDSLGRIKPLGRLVIDLPDILAKENNIDVTLRAGDTINIPKFKQSVTVVGEVQFPTSHFYNAKLDAKDYIQRSGGTNMRADKRRIYVVKANGNVVLPNDSKWFRRGAGGVNPGDTVVVPLDSDRIKSLTLWTNVSEIFYQIALGAAAVASF